MDSINSQPYYLYPVPQNLLSNNTDEVRSTLPNKPAFEPATESTFDRVIRYTTRIAAVVGLSYIAYQYYKSSQAEPKCPNNSHCGKQETKGKYNSYDSESNNFNNGRRYTFHRSHADKGRASDQFKQDNSHFYKNEDETLDDWIKRANEFLKNNDFKFKSNTKQGGFDRFHHSKKSHSSQGKRQQSKGKYFNQNSRGKKPSNNGPLTNSGAKRLLKLQDTPSKKQINKACRIELVKRHPDVTKLKNPQFEKYSEACNLLKNKNSKFREA